MRLQQRLVRIAHERLFVRATLQPEDRAALNESYRADIDQLQGLIGRDLAHWLR